MSAVSATEPVRIEVWSDVACPWCLLGNAHLAEATRQTGIETEVVMRSFQLAPQLGEPQLVKAYLAERFGGADRVAESHARLIEMGAQVGVSYNFDDAMASNTFDAHRLHHLGIAHGLGAEIMDRLLVAQHTAGADVSSHATLRRIGIAAGLASDAVDALLASDAYGDAVHADISEGRAIGVQGVPFFVFDRKFALSGAQPVDVFKQALASARDGDHP